MDKSSIATASRGPVVEEIKEWQAIMDFLRSLPRSSKEELPVIPVDARATELRAEEYSVLL